MQILLIGAIMLHTEKKSTVNVRKRKVLPAKTNTILPNTNMFKPVF